MNILIGDFMLPYTLLFFFFLNEEFKFYFQVPLDTLGLPTRKVLISTDKNTILLIV